MDPLLRQNIWDYLVTLSQEEKLTVLITTHYIEEARQANLVGLMRFGRILIEESPEFLLKTYNFPTLEEVFLKVCELDSQGIAVNDMHNERKRQEIHRSKSLDNKPDICFDANQIDADSSAGSCSSSDVGDSEQNIIAVDPIEVSLAKVEEKLCKPKLKRRKSVHHSELEHKRSPFMDSTARTSALFWKNITRLRRNLAVLLFQFLLPSIEVILFCTCIGQHPFDINVAVYNQETNGYLSEWFLSHIDNKTIIKKSYPSFDSAIQAVKDGEAWAALVIGENFSSALQSRYK